LRFSTTARRSPPRVFPWLPKMVSIDMRDAIIDDVLHQRLKQSASPLDETVVKGYYSTTNRLNTGDVTTVKGKDIQKQWVTDPIPALEGQMLAPYIQQASFRLIS
jgi:hypothetical protein